MWKNVIGGYKRVAGQSNWAVRNRIPAVISIHALSSVCRQNTSDHVTGALLVTWHVHRKHQLPLAEYNTCRACHCHSLGLSKAPLLSWENPFNIINMFSSQLVPNILLKDGRKKVCPPIHPGECHNKLIPLKLRHSGFRIQWETLLEWRLPSLTKLKWCQFHSHSRTR